MSQKALIYPNPRSVTVRPWKKDGTGRFRLLSYWDSVIFTGDLSNFQGVDTFGMSFLLVWMDFWWLILWPFLPMNHDLCWMQKGNIRIPKGVIWWIHLKFCMIALEPQWPLLFVCQPLKARKFSKQNNDHLGSGAVLLLSMLSSSYSFSLGMETSSAKTEKTFRKRSSLEWK